MAKKRSRSNVKLTDTRVGNVKPGSTVVRVWDSAVSGFHVRVAPRRVSSEKEPKKTYCVSFQRPDGRKVNVTIGECSAWTLDDAREKASELRKMHKEGRDARAHVKAERKAGDFNALVEVWREGYKSTLKPSTQKSYESILKTVILPALGTRTVKDLGYKDVKDLHSKETKEHKTNANRAVAVLSRLISIAEMEGWRPKGLNPCTDLGKNSETPRSRVLTTDEFSRLETRMSELVEIKNLDPSVRDLIHFLALSGLRKGEALKLCWKDVDLDRNTMKFEDHKTSEDSGIKVLPLNSHLKEILKRREVGNKSPYVWPSLKLEPDERKTRKPKKSDHTNVDGPLVGLAKMWARICDSEEARLVDITPHDLRRSFMTVCTELKNPPAIGDTLLGHSLGKIRDTYINLGPEGILATASQGTADWIASALRGENPKPGVKVKKPKSPKRASKGDKADPNAKARKK